eukprot:TRINITY_DN186_c0_g2_i1.p2 TRINITY_DN186_c0_g2~~TRINITY_DN186_c0_g2_i1.p2  ORF type:complete len:258 (-),score=18.58 TRINITY_DN186_c0_g2_i1:868-1641(-)
MNINEKQPIIGIRGTKGHLKVLGILTCSWNCTYKYVPRINTKDIMVPDRCQSQYKNKGPTKLATQNTAQHIFMMVDLDEVERYRAGIMEMSTKEEISKPEIETALPINSTSKNKTIRVHTTPVRITEFLSFLKEPGSSPSCAMAQKMRGWLNRLAEIDPSKAAMLPIEIIMLIQSGARYLNTETKESFTSITFNGAIPVIMKAIPPLANMEIDRTTTSVMGRSRVGLFDSSAKQPIPSNPKYEKKAKLIPVKTPLNP